MKRPKNQVGKNELKDREMGYLTVCSSLLSQHDNDAPHNECSQFAVATGEECSSERMLLFFFFIRQFTKIYFILCMTAKTSVGVIYILALVLWLYTKLKNTLSFLLFDVEKEM